MAKKEREGPVEIRLRVSRKFHSRLEASAKAVGESINSEVIDRLEKSFGLEGKLTLCLGDNWSTAILHGDELLIGVGYDSPQETAVLKFTEGLETFKDHFGVKK